MNLFAAESNFLNRLNESIFNVESILILIACVVAALLIGRLLAYFLRLIVKSIGRKADQAEDLAKVNKLRRYETFIVLSIAVIRTMLVVIGVYAWWIITHPGSQPTALIGASALTAIILGAALSPVLRDISTGSLMMAEQWYGVGDHIKVEPYGDLEGVVEQVTLRSTRLRALNGEVVWLSNQNIWGVRLAPRGIRTMALELFVDDEEAGKRLINRANKRLPMGPLLVITPLTVVASDKVGDKLWHITAIAETAPGREWLIEDSAVQLIKWMDEKAKTSVIAHGPLARYADSEAERSYSRTIQNARKRPAPKKHLVAEVTKEVKQKAAKRKSGKRSK